MSVRNVGIYLQVHQHHNPEDQYQDLTTMRTSDLMSLLSLEFILCLIFFVSRLDFNTFYTEQLERLCADRSVVGSRKEETSG
jgi:hypothetical protein